MVQKVKTVAAHFTSEQLLLFAIYCPANYVYFWQLIGSTFEIASGGTSMM